MIDTFQSSHNLDFEVAPSKHNFDPERIWVEFRVGTCEGMWCVTDTAYEILAIVNRKPNNGHLEDVFEWFENSCRRDNKDLMVLETWNTKFKWHLIKKRHFTDIGGDNLIKYFRK